jgi:hypothetical protein
VDDCGGRSIYRKIRFDEAAYSVEVRIGAFLPNSWRREIYRAGKSGPTGQSSIFFAPWLPANKAGKASRFDKLDGIQVLY